MWILIANKSAKFYAKRLNQSENIPKSFMGLLFLKHPVHCDPEKMDRQYFGHNFDKFRQLFTIFGTNHPDSPRD